MTDDPRPRSLQRTALLPVSADSETASLADDARSIQPANAAADALEPGTLIAGRYRVLHPLGQGGMGSVFVAEHLETRGLVALKVLSHPSETARRRFEVEARNAAALHHPNTIRVTDYGVSNDRPFLVMELVHGKTVADALDDDGPFDWHRTAHVATAVLSALADAHEHELRIIHRDIKPSNIMLTDKAGLQDVVKVLDFGVSAALGGEREDGRGAIGTPWYMAPEQWEGNAATPATDLYQLGCMLHHLLSGAPPFRAATPTLLAIRHITAEPPDLSAATLPGTPQALIDLVRAMMAKAPSDRPPSARDALDSLQRIMRTGSSASVAPEATHAFESPRRPVAPGQAFVGRLEDLHRIDTAFAVGARLLTLRGPGGVGKTRLCRAWGELRGVPDFHFCALSEADSPDRLCQRVAEVLGVRLDADDPVSRLGHALDGRGAITLALDNLEQVVDAAAAVLDRWLVMAPGARFLATSREPLGLADEHVLDVSTLPTPDATLPLADLVANDAVGLFIDRARRVRVDYAPSEQDAHAIAALVRELDGLPLAIELAAARIGMLTPAGMLERLGRRFELLKQRTADLSPRHATLRAAIGWSWQLLTAWERAALAQCSIFTGAFDLSAAEAVVALDAWPDASWAMDVIESLIEKSLIQQEDTAHGPRLTLLSSVRHFALEHLDEPETARRHATHFANLLAPEACIVPTEASAEALDRDFDNLRAAFERALTHPDWPAETLASLGVLTFARMRLTASLAPLRAHLPRLLTLEDLPPHLRVAVVWMTVSVGATPDVDTLALLEEAHQLCALHGLHTLHIRIHWNLAHALAHHGQNARSFEHYRAALQTAQDRADATLLEGYAAATLAVALRRAGDLDAAIPLFDEAARLAREVGDAHLLHFTTYAYGALHLGLGNVAQSEGLLTEALTSARQLNQRHLTTPILIDLGALALNAGDPRAGAWIEEAVREARETGSRHQESRALALLGAVLLQGLQLQHARQTLDRALLLATQLDDPFAMTQASYVLARLMLTLGELSRALALGSDAVEIARRSNLVGNEAWALLACARALALLGRMEAAHEHFARAAERGLRAGDGWLLKTHHVWLAQAHLAAGRLEEARTTLADARSDGAHGSDAQLALARIELAAGRPAAARAALDLTLDAATNDALVAAEQLVLRASTDGLDAPAELAEASIARARALLDAHRLPPSAPLRHDLEQVAQRLQRR